MIDFSSCFSLFTLVHLPWSALVFVGVSSVLWSSFSSISPLLDSLCCAVGWSIFSFVLKSPPSIISCFFCFCRIWVSRFFVCFCYFLYFFRLLGVRRRLLWLYFGLVSSVIHLVSRSGVSSAVLSSFACWEITFLIRIPTAPPFLFLFLAIHLYPLILIFFRVLFLLLGLHQP